MNIKTIIATALIASTALLTGCSIPVADMTLASTKNISINSNTQHDFHKGLHVDGSDSVPIVIFPLGQPSVKKAIDTAISHDSCAVGLTDLRITQFTYGLIPVAGVTGYKVEGDLLIDKALPECADHSDAQTDETPMHISILPPKK